MLARGRVFLLLATLLLAACGDTVWERKVTGGSLGAGAGAIVGAAAPGVGIVGGALTGAAVGGIGGGLTEKEDLDLGPPAWEWIGIRFGRYGIFPQREDTNSYRPGSRRELTGAIQWELYQKSYDPGRADGVSDEATANAVERYQRDHGLSVDGRPSEALWHHISAPRTSG